MNNFHQLKHWMTERHYIYLRRQVGMPREQWTQDKILQTYRFCNVFRELDSVTRWIDQHVRKPYADHPNLWFLLCLSRQINWPPTIEAILRESGLPDVWDPGKVRDIMRRLQAEGRKVYTSAYMLRCDIQKEDGVPNDKPQYTCFRVLDPVFCRRVEVGKLTSIEAWVRWLEQFHGWGGFLSYEVACDLRHTSVLSSAPDIYTWANPGPGAFRGLNRVHGRPLNETVSRFQAVNEMMELLIACNQQLPEWVRQDSWCESADKIIPGKVPLEMRDVEHSLCEVDKYQRALNHEGRPKSIYKPEPHRGW